MKTQVPHTVWCNISGEAAGEIWDWSLPWVKGFKVLLDDSEQFKLQLSVLPLRGKLSSTLPNNHWSFDVRKCIHNCSPHPCSCPGRGSCVTSLPICWRVLVWERNKSMPHCESMGTKDLMNYYNPSQQKWKQKLGLLDHVTDIIHTPQWRLFNNSLLPLYAIEVCAAPNSIIFKHF